MIEIEIENSFEQLGHLLVNVVDLIVLDQDFSIIVVVVDPF